MGAGEPICFTWKCLLWNSCWCFCSQRNGRVVNRRWKWQQRTFGTCKQSGCGGIGSWGCIYNYLLNNGVFDWFLGLSLSQIRSGSIIWKLSKQVSGYSLNKRNELQMLKTQGYYFWNLDLCLTQGLNSCLSQHTSHTYRICQDHQLLSCLMQAVEWLQWYSSYPSFYSSGQEDAVPCYHPTKGLKVISFYNTCAVPVLD